MKLKFLCLTALLSVSTMIYAAPMEVGKFGIANETQQPLSFSVNKICSTELGNVNAYSIKTIDLPIILNLCATSKTCEIVGFDGQKCTGYQVGVVNIDFINRQMKVSNPRNPDNITVGGSIGLYEINIFFNLMRLDNIQLKNGLH